MSTVTIPVIFNNGKTDTLILGSKWYLSSHSGDRYWEPGTGYMHIDTDRESEFYGKSWQANKEEYENAVKDVVIQYFAGKAKVRSGYFRLKYLTVRKGLRPIKQILHDMFFETSLFGEKTVRFKLRVRWFEKKTYEVKDPMDCPPLGGTFQKYFTDNSWLKEAEKLKGETIYLA